MENYDSKKPKNGYVGTGIVMLGQIKEVSSCNCYNKIMTKTTKTTKTTKNYH